MILKFHPKTFIFLFFGFVLFTIVGTLTHELGHLTADRLLGYKGGKINYGSTSWGTKPETEEYFKIYKENESAIKNNLPFSKKQRFEELEISFKNDNFWGVLGGPLQTMTFGTIGILLLYFRKKKEDFKIVDWLITFLSLFWLREVFNLLSGILSGILNNNGNYFGKYGDEVRLSKILEIWDGTIPIFFGILGLIVSLIVIFFFIPKKTRFTFIISGLIGGIFGFWFWLYFLGPIIMP
ncbi:MAG: hypothetical protein COA67_08480 [Lutibacter sp.]|nr:MAG: hypothetical protein COA67_08480 [Lutibacter sp.]